MGYATLLFDFALSGLYILICPERALYTCVGHRPT